jgi:hypothetical protein
LERKNKEFKKEKKVKSYQRLSCFISTTGCTRKRTKGMVIMYCVVLCYVAYCC